MTNIIIFRSTKNQRPIETSDQADMEILAATGERCIEALGELSRALVSLRDELLAAREDLPNEE